MGTNQGRGYLLRDESGQAAALIALLLFFVFLPLAALAIDGSSTYLLRRQLQNVADAATLSACRVIANNVTTTTPMAAALNTISRNLGSTDRYVGTNPPATNTGVGASLIQGIEVASPQVRVALQAPAPTVLTQFFGRGQTMVSAQARCDVRAGGLLMPFAMKRYEGLGKNPAMTDYVANKNAPIYPTDSTISTNPPFWHNTQYNYDVMVPVPLAQYTASDGRVSDPNTGPEVTFIGPHSGPNSGGPGFNDFVMLDMRNLASPNAVEYYHGVSGNPNSNKNVSQGWIYQHGYPGPYPQPGSEIAILDGLSNNFTAKAMSDAGFQQGDAVALMIYDGNVWSPPDFVATLTPDPGNPNGITSGYPNSPSTAVSYMLTIAKPGGNGQAAWITPLSFNLTLDFSNSPVPTGTQVTLSPCAGGTASQVTPDVPVVVSNVTEGSGWCGRLLIWSTSAYITQTSQYLSGLNLLVDSSLGLSHGDSSNFGFGAVANNDYTASTDTGRLVIRQNGSVSADLVTFSSGSSFTSGCNAQVVADLLLNGAPQSWSAYFSSSQTASVRIAQNTYTTLSFPLAATLGAFVGSYSLRFTVNSPCGGTAIPSHTAQVPLTIDVEGSSQSASFVIVQGYAVFRISSLGANDVSGYAISPLVPSLSNVTIGGQPRLVPWN